MFISPLSRSLTRRISRSLMNWLPLSPRKHPSQIRRSWELSKMNGITS